MKDKATVRIEYKEEDWGNTWRKALGKMEEGIAEIENINSTSMTSAEKFKRMLDIKREYHFENVPVDIIEASLLSEVKNLKGAVLEKIEQGVVLKLDHLEVKFMLGYNSGIVCEDTSEYHIVFHKVDKLNEEAELLVSWYQKYLRDEVNEKELVDGFIVEFEECRKRRGVPQLNSLTKKEIASTFGKGKFIIESFMKKKEMYEKEEEEIERTKELNKAREKKRVTMLNSSGLKDFLISFEKQGIKLISVGIYGDNFIK